MNAWTMPPPPPEPKRVLITGGTRGIGKELAKKMVSKGFEVVITTRNEKLAEEVKLSLDGKRRKLFSYVMFNMESVSSVERDLQGVKEKFIERPFDIVVMNAGVMFPDAKNTPVEPTFQVNYLAHFMLAEMLLKEKPIEHKMHFVGVSSIMMKYCLWPFMVPPKTKESMETVFGPREGAASGWREYAFSKMALAQLCADLGHHPNVTAVSVNPGNSPTDIAIRMPGWQRSILRIFFKSTLVPVSTAAERVLFATETRLSNPANFLNMSEEAPLPDYIVDDKARHLLVEFSEKLIGRNSTVSAADILQ